MCRKSCWCKRKGRLEKKELKQFSDIQTVNLQQSTDSYDNITKIGEYTGYMELSQISKRLSEIYSSMGVLNKSLVDYL